ncbi:MAG TPA: helix-turn-helix domain-containing protein [Solirubrobacteraceae bacterium]|nr:helix-turn-helix domain-containing protein [Solirubrobacteraceae bacterium]
MSWGRNRAARAQARTDAPAEGTRARIMLAAIEQCQELGLRRTTMEDVARRAGLGRATLYRHFQSKDALVREIILAETEAFFAALDGALAECSSDAERLVEGFAFALHYIRAHALLNKLLRSEPETLLPYLIGGGELIRTATRDVCARVHGDGGDAERVRESAELLVRLVLSLALTPESALGADTPEGAKRLARRHLVTSLRGGA